MKRPLLSEIQVPIGGVQKLSLVDYPGHTAAAMFTLGCNMRCGYCHNPELVLPEQLLDPIPLDDIFDWLETRRGKIEAVVVSGGEPTIHEDLPKLFGALKNMGFLTKLDSNGTHPDMLAEMIDRKIVDFIAMDIKGPIEKYTDIAARPIDIEAIQKSIKMIISSGIDHEFRTTIVKGQLEVKDFEAIGKIVKGAKRYALQKFQPGTTLSPIFQNMSSFNDDEMSQTQKIMEGYVQKCVIH